MKCEGLFGFITNYLQGLEKIKEDINSTIFVVKHYASLLGVNLSLAM